MRSLSIVDMIYCTLYKLWTFFKYFNKAWWQFFRSRNMLEIMQVYLLIKICVWCCNGTICYNLCIDVDKQSGGEFAPLAWKNAVVVCHNIQDGKHAITLIMVNALFFFVGAVKFFMTPINVSWRYLLNIFQSLQWW